jgi:hypothetical protein
MVYFCAFYKNLSLFNALKTYYTFLEGQSESEFSE